jgi:hypothetical protein
MDDRKTSIALSLHDPGGWVGAGQAPTAPGVRRSTEVESKPAGPSPAGRFPADPLREDPIIVYCGHAQRVSEGFAIASQAIGVALGAMGIDANPFHEEVAPPSNNSDRKDD